MSFLGHKKQLGGTYNPALLAQPHDGTAYTSTKGLLNGPGQNNCFLNSAVQVLWHLDIFRRSFRELSGHACMAESCIFCALKELFGQLQFSQESALPPDALRRALAESFFDQQRFQLGFMDDAAECFENILLRIHYHIASSEVEDMCNARHCIPHQKFAMTLVEQSVCETCHVTSEPLSYTQMVHYVSASALTSQAGQAAKSGQPAAMFGQLLRKAGGMGDIRDCPSLCGSKIQICRVLMNRPEIVSVGVVWDSERPTLDHIMAVFATIGTSLRLSDVFHSVMDQRWAANTTHSLVGVVTYYGKHYSTFFFHTKLRVWIYFDDATVREIGPHFTQVVEKCRRGRYQPLLLLYTVQGGTPVSTEGAPKTVVMKPANHSGDKLQPIRRSIIKPTGDMVDTKPPIRRGAVIPTNEAQQAIRRDPRQTTRRSVTPSPEKTRSSTSPRRAITPNPGASPNTSTEHYQKPPVSNADYQNLSHIQASIFADPAVNYQNPLQRANSAYAPGPGTNRYPDGILIPDHLNVPRRRDSGNWSGDRNSASSSSSLENPYLYLKLHHQRQQAAPPAPPDMGYDSYSLSSNDSLPLQQGLKHNLQLSQIPENHQAVPAAALSSSVDECERLCVEADNLLEKCLALEDSCDLETALAVCQAAAGKTRAAMEAPYNNPQTLTFARMKHNACVMRSRSLHRRLVHMQLQAQAYKEDPLLDIRHSRENSSSSSRSANHSRQNSRDKTLSAQHSRQSSRELAPLPVLPPCDKPTKNIEIYATLPRKKLSRNKPAENVIEDAEYMYDRPGRSLYSRAGKKREEEKTTKEKRARSEERSKNSRDYSMLSLSSLSKDAATNKKEEKPIPKKEKPKEEKKQKDGKKQHKIRRKLLMGGLIRRKNRSMPDLREGEDAPGEVIVPQEKLSQDDSALTSKQASLSGYLSEGHLEYTCTNMEKSKLMRRTSHKERAGVLPPKVPPLPPLRTTSQLTLKEDRPQYPLPDGFNSSYVQSENSYGSSPNSSYQSESSYLQPFRASSESPNIYQNSIVNKSDSYPNAYQSNNPEPYYQGNGSYLRTDNFPQNYTGNTETVPNVPLTNPYQTGERYPGHEGQYPPEVTYANGGILLEGAMQHGDSIQNLVLPPYPAVVTSANHSRQPSEEFPPPPPPLDMPPPAPDGGLLAQLQTKRQQILDKECLVNKPDAEPTSAKSGEQWLKELQAKQAERRLKKSPSSAQSNVASQSKPDAASDNLASVRDLASRFENIRTSPATVSPNTVSPSTVPNRMNTEAISRTNESLEMVTRTYETNSIPREKNHFEEVVRNSPQEDQRQAITSGYNSSRDETDEVRRNNPPDIRKIPLKFDTSDVKRKSGKKKNVTFCDEVILVATAEDEEDDSFIPNPILERVLRSAFKHDAADGRTSQVDGRTSQVDGKASQADWQAANDARVIEETRSMYKQLELRNADADRYYQPPDQQSGFYQQVQTQQVYNRTVEPNRTQMQPDPRLQTQPDPRFQMPSDTRTQILPDARSQMSPDPRIQMSSDPRIQMPSDPRIQMAADPRNVVQPQSQNDARSALSPDLRPQSDGRSSMLGDPNRSYLQSNLRPIVNGYQTNASQYLSSSPQSAYVPSTQQVYQASHQPQQPLQQQQQQPPISHQQLHYQQQKQPLYTQQTAARALQNSQYQYSTKSVPQPATGVQPTYQQVPQLLSQQQKPVGYGQQQYQQSLPQQAYQHVPQQKSTPSGQQVSQVYQQLPQQLPQNHQTLPQTHQQLPQSHQQLSQQHQQLSQTHQQLPQQHQQLSQTHQQLPQTHQQLPQTHQQLQQNHQQLQQNHQQLPQTHQQLPQTHQQLQQNHQQLPQNHQQLPQNVQQLLQQNQQLSQNHQQLPQSHQQLLQNHQQLPQSHQQFLQNHQLPQQTQSPQIYQQLPQQSGQTLPGKQQQQGVYQRVPPPATSYPPYQHPPPPRTLDPAAKAAPCHLCRKKPVVAPAVYCTDCHFYMSRFKPRT